MAGFRTMLAGEFHLGDNAGYYQSATYVGLSLRLPCRVDFASLTDTITFRIQTSAIETWGGSAVGHPVLINTTQIGQLVDTNDVAGPSEQFDLSIGRAEFEEATNKRQTFVLSVLVNDDVGTGLLDDFLLKRIGVDGARIILGWA